MVRIFCPFCGDIMQNTRSIAYKKGKGGIMICDDCKNIFLFSPLSDKEIKSIKKQIEKGNK